MPHPAPHDGKRDIRRRIALDLAATTHEQRTGWSAAIVARLRRLPAVASAPADRPVMGFLPLLDEANLEPLLRERLAAGGRIALPRVDWSGVRMDAVEVRDLAADVAVGRHGLREPRPDLPILPLASIAAIIVPGMAFTPAGLRLGRGGGFYDRFLSTPGLAAPTIGVCFELQVVPDLPREPHDAAVDTLITESRG